MCLYDIIARVFLWHHSLCVAVTIFLPAQVSLRLQLLKRARSLSASELCKILECRLPYCVFLCACVFFHSLPGGGGGGGGATEALEAAQGKRQPKRKQSWLAGVTGVLYTVHVLCRPALCGVTVLVSWPVSQKVLVSDFLCRFESNISWVVGRVGDRQGKQFRAWVPFLRWGWRELRRLVWIRRRTLCKLSACSKHAYANSAQVKRMMTSAHD